MPALTDPAAETSAAITDGLALVAAAHAAEAAAAEAQDHANFLTWTGKNWDNIPYDNISFPEDQSPLKTKVYYSAAVIF